jgi:hypothetical protein
LRENEIKQLSEINNLVRLYPFNDLVDSLPDSVNLRLLLSYVLNIGSRPLEMRLILSIAIRSTVIGEIQDSAICGTTSPVSEFANAGVLGTVRHGVQLLMCPAIFRDPGGNLGADQPFNRIE